MNHLYITTHKDPSLIKSGDVFFTSWSGREGVSFFSSEGWYIMVFNCPNPKILHFLYVNICMISHILFVLSYHSSDGHFLLHVDHDDQHYWLAI